MGVLSEPSEIRGVFVKGLYGGDTWAALAASYAPYAVNWLVGEACGTYFSRSNLTSLGVSDQTYDYIGEGITAAHANDMKFTAMMLMQFLGGEVTLDPNLHAVNQNGDVIRWVCPLKAYDLIINVTTEIATEYPALDGFMFDYIRYATDYNWTLCYCEECHQRFVADTGLTDTVWRTDVVPTRKYYDEFMEWRVTPITELVRDVRATMLAINSTLEFSIATLALWYIDPTGYGHPIRQWFGQDTATMVGNGYLDVVCPLQYTTDLALLEGIIETNTDYLVGGTEGKAALVPFIGGLEDIPGDMTAADLEDNVDLCRSLGTDGFIIYQQISGFVAEYLDPLPMIDIFTITNLNVATGGGVATLTWTTSDDATSTVEYSGSPLFYAEEKVTGSGFKYYDVQHAAFSTEEDLVPDTAHSIEIPFTGAPIHARIQSSDGTTILSSEPFVIEGSEIPIVKKIAVLRRMRN